MPIKRGRVGLGSRRSGEKEEKVDRYTEIDMSPIKCLNRLDIKSKDLDFCLLLDHEHV